MYCRTMQKQRNLRGAPGSQQLVDILATTRVRRCANGQDLSKEETNILFLQVCIVAVQTLFLKRLEVEFL